jgi:hypothetical protein
VNQFVVNTGQVRVVEIGAFQVGISQVRGLQAGSGENRCS